MQHLMGMCEHRRKKKSKVRSATLLLEPTPDHSLVPTLTPGCCYCAETNQICLQSWMLPLRKPWHQLNISLSAPICNRSVKEMMELVEGGGMPAEAQQTSPILMMEHGPLTARKQRDYLNQDNLAVQFTHLNTSCGKQTAVKCYWKPWRPTAHLISIPQFRVISLICSALS